MPAKRPRQSSSISRHHAEWLSLVEVSGPFLSLPVLIKVFPHGLEPRDGSMAASLRAAYEDWSERQSREPVLYQQWIRWVLNEFLGWSKATVASGQDLPPGLQVTLPEVGASLKPDLALFPAQRKTEDRSAILVSIQPPGQALEHPVFGQTWKASPATRMVELLRGTDVSCGLVTNGEHWMLVHAPRGETAGFASWYADLWMQEPVTLRAFHSLLGLHRLLGVSEEESLATLYAQSADDQQEVTNQLGLQVRHSVEILIQAIDRMDQGLERKLLADFDEKQLYEAALTVMMRLVFLFCAEERGLLRLGEKFYDQHYALSPLCDLLRETADRNGEEVLERKHDAWCRLLAAFRAVHGGCNNESMPLPAYGGTLFDPDRFPFLEGRPSGTTWHDTTAEPLPINNRVVLHLLESLQFLQVQIPRGGAAESRRLSFRALDIEQIGHVYEGLLDHTAERATQVILGIDGTKGKEPNVPLSQLEILLRREGETAVAEFLMKPTGRTAPNAITNKLSLGAEDDSHDLLVACGHDAALVRRVTRFAGLLRRDSFGRLVVIHPSSIYVTAGTDRRSTGTHYTPRSLTEPIVQHTLEPLVYHGPSEGKEKEEWKLRTAKQILDLRVCDMTMGSGAFLVQVCRYLAERLVESWSIAEEEHPGTFIATPDGELSTGSATERLLPNDLDERVAVARRYVADRCIYGVDINPMAVEMAKLSLWLITLQRDRPFTFLDHALKCGDSLLGASTIEQVENFSLRPGHRQVAFATANLFRYVEAASAKRCALENLPCDDPTQIETKNRLHAEAEVASAKVRAVADCLVALELCGLEGDVYEDNRIAEAEKVQMLMKRDSTASLNSQTPTNHLSAHARALLRGRRPFHWAVEFPEVVSRGGFDAFVGNPPFMGGQKITGAFGSDYRDYLVDQVAYGQRGSADLCAYFFLRCHTLLRANGGISGLLATNTIAQGDTREVGLEQLAAAAQIIRAVPSAPWPGVAALEISHVWLRGGRWDGKIILDGKPVSAITPFLNARAANHGKPYRLASNINKSFQGSNLLGAGFILESSDAQRLLKESTRNQDILYPLLNGEELNSIPNQRSERWAINFQDWPLEKAEEYSECLAIVRERVKPERDRLACGDATARDRSRRWWQYARPTRALYSAIEDTEETLVGVITTKFWTVSWCCSKTVFSHALVVFALKGSQSFGLLASTIHELWTREYSGSLETRLRYSPSDCFETFPFPSSLANIADIGERYHEYRRQIMQERQEGLTKIYNRFHDRGETSVGIAKLRALHVEMDQAVAFAYGWSDLEMGHGFHSTRQGERYTLNQSVRCTVLDRLLALNHEQYKKETNAGLHERRGNKGKARQTHQPDFFES